MNQIKTFLKDHSPKNGNFYTIAIDGRGGAGKTALVEHLKKLLPGFTFINGDDYFEPTPKEIAWGDFNDERFKADVIEPIKQGRTTINYRPYDWHKEPHITEQTIEIDKGICIERCYTFAFDMDWDLRIWIETPAAISFKRGLERDKMLKEQATRAWKEVWQPREDAYIKRVNPLKIADIVVDGTRPFEGQI